MGDYSKLQVIIKRIGAYLSTKVSKIFNTHDFRSVWAIAGFAVAVIFAWRVLRKPNGSRRRSQPKSQPPTPSTSGSYSDDFKAQSGVDDLFLPANATLGQIVRQRLSDGRKVTCRLLGVVLEENTPEELQNQATVKSSVLEVLIEITKCSDLYLMETVLDDESEKKVLIALENAGIFTYGGLVKEKVLFCSTEKGRMSFVRQLEPDWHIDSDPQITSQLAVISKKETNEGQISHSLTSKLTNIMLVVFRGIDFSIVLIYITTESYLSINFSLDNRGSSNTSFTFQQRPNELLLMFPAAHHWKSFLVFDFFGTSQTYYVKQMLVWIMKVNLVRETTLV